MTEPVRDLLRAFDALSPAEREQAAAEILRRATPGGDLPEATFDDRADKRPRDDAEEAALESLGTAFLRGMGSVLEFFPPPERFDAWRLL
jgi:hypothetical protein